MSQTEHGGGQLRRGGGRGRILKWHHEVPVPTIPNVNFASLLVDLLSQYGDDIALVDAATDQSLSYSDLRTTILRTRAGLVSAGIGSGDSVMLLSKNNINFPVAMLAVMLSGATCVPANPSLNKDELAHLARVSEAKWAIANDDITGKVQEAYAQIGPKTLKKIWVMEENTRGKPSLHDLMISDLDVNKEDNIPDFSSAKTVALMLLSSGTTGLPKGVMLSHRNLLTTYMQAIYQKSIRPETGLNIYESTFLFVPMYHLYGYNTIVGALMSGGKLVVRNQFSPEQYFQTIEKYRVTYSPLVPHIIKFLGKSTLAEKYDLSSLMLFLSGSSPISESSLENLSEKTGSMAVQAYAMTETCATVSVNAGVAGSKPESLGRVCPYFEAKIIDIETGEMLGEGEEGELCVRGPGVTLGYANNPGATGATIDSEGWLHTGDLFYFDEDEFLYITDRIKDLIKVKGYQVSPTEIENLLMKLDEVRDVAVAGVPNDRTGEAPRAWVIPAKGALIDPEKLIKHVADHLSPYKQLSGGVEVVESLPKNHLGKILRRQLKKSYMATRSKLYTELPPSQFK